MTHRPSLATPRLSGRPAGRADWPLVAELLAAPETGPWLAANGPLAAEAAEAAARRVAEGFAEAWASEGVGPWIWRVGARDIGWAGLRRARLDRRVAWEAIWAMRPAAQGRGYATEAAAAAIAELRAGDAETPILAWTLPMNAASLRVIAKLGLRADGAIERAGLPHLMFRLDGSAEPPA